METGRKEQDMAGEGGHMEVGQHFPVASGLSWLLEICTTKYVARSGKSQVAGTTSNGGNKSTKDPQSPSISFQKGLEEWTVHANSCIASENLNPGTGKTYP